MDWTMVEKQLLPSAHLYNLGKIAHLAIQYVDHAMRYPGPPYRHEEQCCWQDPEGKKHYRFKTHHII